VQYGDSKPVVHGKATGTANNISLEAGEFITSVTVGTGLNNPKYTYISELTFSTPSKIYGPFRASFKTIDVWTTSLFNGLAYFAGQSDVFSLNLLLFYYYGNVFVGGTIPYGKFIDFGYHNDIKLYLEHAPVSAIFLWVGTQIHCLQALYGDAMTPVRGLHHKNSYDPTISNSIFSNAGEVITNITVGWGKYVCSLTFVSTMRTYGPYKASACQTNITTSLKVNRLLWLWGWSGYWNDQIGFGYSGS